MNNRSFIIAVFLAPVVLSGCGGDMKLIARKAWTEVTTTPPGTVSTAWAIRHPRLIEIELETEYLRYAYYGGPYTYEARLYERMNSHEELRALLATWTPANKFYLAEEAPRTTEKGPS